MIQNIIIRALSITGSGLMLLSSEQKQAGFLLHLLAGCQLLIIESCIPWSSLVHQVLLPGDSHTKLFHKTLYRVIISSKSPANKIPSVFYLNLLLKELNNSLRFLLTYKQLTHYRTLPTV